MELEVGSVMEERKDLSAIGTIESILYNRKTEVVKSIGVREAKVLSLHGSTGNGKSMLSVLKGVSRIFNSGREEQNFYLAGRDIISLERRFVKSNRSVLNWYPFKGRWSYQKIGVGGSVIKIQARSGEKYLYMTPFNNASAYGRILGDTADGFIVDEATEADEEFLKEMMLRVNRTTGCWAILTSNGGDPAHYFYTHIVNKSVMLDDLYDVEYGTPEIERRYIEEEKEKFKGFVYVHMGLLDNPAYRKEQLEMFDEMYPSGSFMHWSRVLGVRGFSLDSPFAAYMTDSVYIKRENLSSEGFYPNSIVFSVDSGGHVFSREKFEAFSDEYGKWYSEYIKGEHGTAEGGHTVMITVGFSMDYKRAVVLDTYFPNHMHQNINVDRMYDRVYNVVKGYPRVRLPYLFVDDADPNMLALMRDKKTLVREVRKAVKRENKINLDEKVVITLIQQYLMRGNLRVLDTMANRRWFVPAMISASLDNDGKLVDNRKEEADIQDGLKYVFGSMYRLLV